MTLGIEPHETRAAIAAGKLAGEFLESIGKTDLAKLTPLEWQTFCEVMCVNYNPLDEIPY